MPHSISEIHKGDNTHTHDQVITLQSLRTINTTSKTPDKPKPPPAVPFEFLLIFNYLSFSIFSISQTAPNVKSFGRKCYTRFLRFFLRFLLKVLNISNSSCHKRWRLAEKARQKRKVLADSSLRFYFYIWKYLCVEIKFIMIRVCMRTCNILNGVHCITV